MELNERKRFRQLVYNFIHYITRTLTVTDKMIVLRFASPVNSDDLMKAAGEAITLVDEAHLETAQLSTLGSYAILKP